VRADLAERHGAALRTIALSAGAGVRFYQSTRGRRFRIARFDTNAEARRVARGIRAARRRLGVHVPKVHADWVRDRVVVTEMIGGRAVPQLGPTRLARCARLLARLHNIDISQDRSLGPVRQCFADRFDDLVRHARRVSSRQRPHGMTSWLRRYRRLRDHRWPRVLVHGDPHEENFVWLSSGRPALIDWDMSRPGPPHLDLAYLLYWRAHALSARGQLSAWKRTVLALWSVYNRSAYRRRLELGDLLSWVGLVGLIYVGFGAMVRDGRFIPVAAWVWTGVREIAVEEGCTLA